MILAEVQVNNCMARLLTNIPHIECLVRSEFLYDHESGHGTYLDCFWVTAKRGALPAELTALL